MAAFDMAALIWKLLIWQLFYGSFAMVTLHLGLDIEAFSSFARVALLW